MNSLLALYEPEASHVCEDGSAPNGYAGIRPVLDQFAAMQPTLDVKLRRVAPAGNDLAVLYDHWTLAAEGSHGDATHMQGKSVHIVRRQADGTGKFAVTGVTNADWQPSRQAGGFFRCLGRRNYGVHFEFDEVAPVGHPFVQQRSVAGLHDLPAALERLIYPTRNVPQTVRRHAALLTKSTINRRGIAAPEMLHHHEQHEPQGS